MTCPVASLPVVTGRNTHAGAPEGDVTIGMTPHPPRPKETELSSSRPSALATRTPHRPDSFDDAGTTSVYAQHFDPVFGRRFAERALDSLVVVRGARVLDVACGTGIFARMAAHVVGPGGRVVGIDPSAIAVSTARRIDPTSIVDWRQWDDDGLPFDDGAFDVVACQHALHRFPDPLLIVE